MNRILAFLIAVIAANSSFAQMRSWSNPLKPASERTDSLIKSLTLDEKISLLMYNNPAIPRLEIPAFNWWNEALHGVARNGKATVFPQAINLASTFNDSLLKEVARTIGIEARAKYNVARKMGNTGQYAGLTFWSPNINIFRDARWGRGQETYGEDPFLTSRMGVAFVNGLQGEDRGHPIAAACAKHYVVHSGPEKSRHAFNATPPLKDFNDTYLPAFKALVTEAKVEGVMCAYNRTYDLPCCGSDTLLHSILRDQWGFKGYVVTDCYAISDMVYYHKFVNSKSEGAALAIQSGVNLDCGDEFLSLRDALKEKRITESQVDLALAPLLNLRFRLGNLDAFGNHPLDSLDEKDVHTPAAASLAYRAAVESIVLLKNNGALPLNPALLQNISLFGPLANDDRVLLGNYHGYSPDMKTVLEGIVQAIPSGTALNFNEAFPLFGAKTDYTATISSCSNSQAVIVCMGLNSLMQGEEGDASMSDASGDLNSLELPDCQLSFLKVLRKSFSKPIIVLLFSGSPLIISEIEKNCDGLFWCGYPGEQGGLAAAHLILGKENPSGKLPFTFPKSLNDLPDFDDYRMAGRTYRFANHEEYLPFGYGLSYSIFHYSSLEIQKDTATQVSSYKAKVTIQNVSTSPGREAVQIYLRKAHPSKTDPHNELVGFQSVYLYPGEIKTIEVPLSENTFVSYTENGSPQIEKGKYTFGLVSTKRKDNATLRELEIDFVVR